MTSLSIIVPVYNTKSDYLEKCLKSCFSLAQKTDCEIILLNDGSTDLSTNSICDAYSQNNYFLYLKFENKGVSFARNKGIEIASKQYLMFVDSDDELDVEAIADFLNCYDETKYDYVRFGFELINNKDKVIKKYYIDADSFYGDGACWSKMFRREIIVKHNLKFDTSIKYGEDSLFLEQFLLYSNSKITVSLIAYKYRISLSNVSHRYNPHAFEDFNKTLELRKNQENMSCILLLFLSRFILPLSIYHKENHLKAKEKRAIVCSYLTSDKFVYSKLLKGLNLEKKSFYWKLQAFCLRHKFFKTMIRLDYAYMHIFKRYL